MSWDNEVSVTLHNDSLGFFYTGDIVTGTIKLDLKKDLVIKSIDMEIIGISKAQWTRFSPTVPYLKIYSEKKKILFIKQNNLFIEEIQIGRRLPAGIHCYYFHFALPHDLPSTFKTSIASVNYYLKIQSKPSGKLKKIVPFNVLANVNLNSLDDMLKPSEYEFQQGFRSSSKIVVHLKTYISFAPGQLIPFDVTINNDDLVKIRKIKVILVQKLRYTVHSGYADEENDMCEAVSKKIENTIMEVCNFFMEIPQLAPSSITSTEPMIDISYEFRVEVLFSYHLNLIEIIPVTVAAVPVIHNDF